MQCTRETSFFYYSYTHRCHLLNVALIPNLNKKRKEKNWTTF